VRQLAPVYADSDVVALSSLNEGTPVALIEAMASGVPVVGTEVGGVPDVLGRGARGELVPARDPEALADAIERALEPKARARAATHRQAIMDEYGKERLGQDLVRLYEELLREYGDGA
jgi:glycosyltransferase involved in cell wall biosynthesis